MTDDPLLESAFDASEEPLHPQGKPTEADNPLAVEMDSREESKESPEEAHPDDDVYYLGEEEEMDPFKGARLLAAAAELPPGFGLESYDPFGPTPTPSVDGQDAGTPGEDSFLGSDATTVADTYPESTREPYMTPLPPPSPAPGSVDPEGSSVAPSLDEEAFDVLADVDERIQEMDECTRDSFAEAPLAAYDDQPLPMADLDEGVVPLSSLDDTPADAARLPPAMSFRESLSAPEEDTSSPPPPPPLISLDSSDAPAPPPPALLSLDTAPTPPTPPPIAAPSEAPRARPQERRALSEPFAALQPGASDGANNGPPARPAGERPGHRLSAPSLGGAGDVFDDLDAPRDAPPPPAAAGGALPRPSMTDEELKEILHMQSRIHNEDASAAAPPDAAAAAADATQQAADATQQAADATQPLLPAFLEGLPPEEPAKNTQSTRRSWEGLHASASGPRPRRPTLAPNERIDVPGADKALDAPAPLLSPRSDGAGGAARSSAAAGALLPGFGEVPLDGLPLESVETPKEAPDLAAPAAVPGVGPYGSVFGERTTVLDVQGAASGFVTAPDEAGDGGGKLGAGERAEESGAVYTTQTDAPSFGSNMMGEFGIQEIDFERETSEDERARQQEVRRTAGAPGGRGGAADGSPLCPAAPFAPLLPSAFPPAPSPPQALQKKEIDLVRSSVDSKAEELERRRESKQEVAGGAAEAGAHAHERTSIGSLGEEEAHSFLRAAAGAVESRDSMEGSDLVRLTIVPGFGTASDALVAEQQREAEKLAFERLLSEGDGVVDVDDAAGIAEALEKVRAACPGARATRAAGANVRDRPPPSTFAVLSRCPPLRLAAPSSSSPSNSCSSCFSCVPPLVLRARPWCPLPCPSPWRCLFHCAHPARRPKGTRTCPSRRCSASSRRTTWPTAPSPSRAARTTTPSRASRTWPRRPRRPRRRGAGAASSCPRARSCSSSARAEVAGRRRPSSRRRASRR